MDNRSDILVSIYVYSIQFSSPFHQQRRHAKSGDALVQIPSRVRKITITALTFKNGVEINGNNEFRHLNKIGIKLGILSHYFCLF